MRGHRYKTGGWFGESHRHYLAAKGMKTKYNAHKSMYRYGGKDMMSETSDMMYKDEDEMQMEQSEMADMDDFNMRMVRNEVKEDVIDIPKEVKMDMDFNTGFKLSDTAAMPGSLVKDAGSAIGSLVSFSKDVIRR